MGHFYISVAHMQATQEYFFIFISSSAQDSNMISSLLRSCF